jgi:two-component system CheB/CheR fusion protein
VQSANEELQSINEELETSKEELESANEELTTVNEEMSSRNAELNRLNSDLVNLQTSTKLAIVLLGRDLTVRRFSMQAEKQFDLLSADVGRPISRLRHGLVTGNAALSDAASLDLASLIGHVIDDVREQEHEVRDRTGRWYSLRVRPYFTLDNKVDGAVMVLVDIDELKRAEAETRQLTAELRASEAQLRRDGAELASAAGRREEFLAMLGHELRNPLTAIARGLDLLGKKPAEEARAEELRTMMVRQAERISKLLDQLLDIARVVSDKVELAQERVDLNDVAHAAVETVTPIVENQKHALVLELPPNGPCVLGDAVRLTQVVENLLTNAAKYTPDGGRIVLSIDTKGAQARVVVRDSGVGLSADFLPHVFEVFTQSPRSLDRAQGGLGLGLPLARRVVEMHGGKLEASSPGLDRGSEFVATLPLAPEQRPKGSRQPKDSRRAPIKGPARRILLVDDEAAIADVLAELLAEEGHQTLAVNSGAAALDALSAFRPEVILLDLGLPEVDGFEVARRLRAARGGERVLLIAVSGYEPGAASLKEAGFDRHLVKPPNMRELAGMLAAWSDGRALKDERV